MAVPAGTATTYDLTVGTMLDIEDMIHMLNPMDTPLTGGYLADGRSALPNGTAYQKKVEWIHEEILTPRSAIATATTVVTAATAIVVTAGDRLKFSTGDVLLIDSEYVRVTGYNATADTLDISRSYASSTAAQHIAGAVIVGVGTVLPEGSNPEAPRWVDRTGAYNMTQIFGPTAVTVSATEQVIRKYGLAGTTEFQHQIANRMKEHWIAFEQSLMYGVRNEDTSNKLRSMGGFAFFITAANGATVDSTTTAFSEATLLAMAEAVFGAGGNPSIAVMNAKNKRLASAFTSSGQLQLQRADQGRGVVVTYFDSDFGRISFVLDRWAKVGDVFLFDREQTQIATLRPLVMEMLAKTGDSITGQVVCEKTLKFRRPRHAGRFTALT